MVSKIWRKGSVPYGLLVTFYLVLSVLLAIILFSRANSEIYGEAFKQRVDNINLRLILNQIPSSGYTKITYPASNFSYNLDNGEGKIYILDGKHVFGYYGKDEEALILLDEVGNNLVLEGRNG
ncbi:hypothetical protein HYT58_01975 [Candidatus Woesearchaeota archaeon]|nr:hypothetical protein [Candidatus Woesearchaeota archaeon]